MNCNRDKKQPHLSNVIWQERTHDISVIDL